MQLIPLLVSMRSSSYASSKDMLTEDHKANSTVLDLIKRRLLSFLTLSELQRICLITMIVKDFIPENITRLIVVSNMQERIT